MTLKAVRQATKRALLAMLALGAMAASHQAAALVIAVDLDPTTAAIDSTFSAAAGSTIDGAFVIEASTDGSDAGLSWDTFSVGLRNDNPLVGLNGAEHGALTSAAFLFFLGGIAFDPGLGAAVLEGDAASISASETAGATLIAGGPWSVAPPPPGIPPGVALPLIVAEYTIAASASGTALFDLGDPGDTQLLSFGNALDVTLESATPTIETVPAPAPIGVMLLGLVALVLRKRLA